MVVGVPDPGMGQEICACFVPSDPSLTEECVRGFVEKDIVAKADDPLSAQPRYTTSVSNPFPKPTLTKPLRKDVRVLAAQKLNLN